MTPEDRQDRDREVKVEVKPGHRVEVFRKDLASGSVYVILTCDQRLESGSAGRALFAEQAKEVREFADAMALEAER